MDRQQQLPEQLYHTTQQYGNSQIAATSRWHNITTWAYNISRHATILEDIFWAGPRFVAKLGSFMSHSDPLTAPRQLAPDRGETLAQAVSDASIFDILKVDNAVPTASTVGGGNGETDRAAQIARLSIDSARGLGSVFSYVTSKWAVSCIVMAIILNRTHILAATRRRLRIPWHTRLLVRLLPSVLLALQAVALLQFIQCQTSPNFSHLGWKNTTKASDMASAQPYAFLNRLSSILLLGAGDSQSCEAVGMIPSTAATNQQLRGSLAMLWPLFWVLCLSHFVETLLCAVQGRPLSAETGMTLFEQSLAFAEADAVVNNHLRWGRFSTQQLTSDSSPTNMAAHSITRSMLLGKLNTSPEVLFVAFLTTMTHLSSHCLGIFDAQSRYRLVNTGFWGVFFMGTLTWSAFDFETGNNSSQSLLRFPTVCIIGYVPHVLVLAGILICLLIYGLALVLTAIAPPSNSNLTSMTVRQRLAYAHSNMQANITVAEVPVTRDMDFYTALLRAGFAAVTMASEAVYLNEERSVNLQQRTWLEEARLREVDQLNRQAVRFRLINCLYDQTGTIGLLPIKEGAALSTNGYSRERAAQMISKGRTGTGASERGSGWLMAVEFLLSITGLIARTASSGVLWVLARAHIRTRPAWLLWLVRRQKITDNDELSSGKGVFLPGETSSLLSESMTPQMEAVDVETEFRRLNSSQDEDVLDKELYKYWASGGWWGSADASGDYVPEDVNDDWDATSVISASSTASDDGATGKSWLSQDKGQQKLNTEISRTRETSPSRDTVLDASSLARLLNPSTSEERGEAISLSRHLQSNIIVTRSIFRRQEQIRRSRVLLPPESLGDYDGGATNRSTRLGSIDEESMLEELILTRRRMDSSGGGLHNGAGQFLPCVVCHSSNRTIIVWPCRCLSLCDDCRVSLARNKFDKCVCCRRDVLSFSRIYTP